MSHAEPSGQQDLVSVLTVRTKDTEAVIFFFAPHNWNYPSTFIIFWPVISLIFLNLCAFCHVTLILCIVGIHAIQNNSDLTYCWNVPLKQPLLSIPMMWNVATRPVSLELIIPKGDPWLLIKETTNWDLLFRADLLAVACFWWRGSQPKGCTASLIVLVKYLCFDLRNYL